MIQNENESSTSIDQNEESRNEKNAKLKAERMWFLILLLSTLLPNCQQQEVAAAQICQISIRWRIVWRILQARQLLCVWLHSQYAGKFQS